MARTFTVYETPNSRKMQLQTPGAGSSTFSYEFTIRPESGSAGTTDEEYQAAYNALRSYLGVPIGKLTDISAYSDSPFGSFGSVRSVNMQHEAGADHVYRAVVTWQSEFPAIYDSSNTDRLVVSGQASINYTSQPAQRNVDIYKSTTQPTALQQTTAAAAGGIYHTDYLIDCRGDNPTYNSVAVESVDVLGKPLKYPALQIEVVIDEPWCASGSIGTSVGTELGLWPKWNANSALIFKRNSAEFMGFPAGSILYMGSTTSPRQFHTHTISHRFVYDEFQHFEQSTWTSVTGIPNISVIEDFLGSETNAACSGLCFWFNPYHVADFSGFDFANAATNDQVNDGFLDWSLPANSGPITA